MKLVLTLVVFSLCAAWVSSQGSDAELEIKSDSAILAREEREALAGNGNKKKDQKKKTKKITKKKKNAKRTNKQNRNNKKIERKKVKKSGNKPNKNRNGKKKKNKKRGRKNRNNKKKVSTSRKKKKKSPGNKNQKSKPRNNKEKLIKQASRAKKNGSKRKKSKGVKATRQDDTCSNTDGVTNECLENAKTVLIFEGYYRNNFLNQYARFKSQNKTRGNKDSKKIDFAVPAQHLADAVGGNLTRMNENMSCVYGGDNKSHWEAEFKSTYDTLINCSNFIAEHCDKLEVDNGTWSAIEKCDEIMQSTKEKTEVCRKIENGADQCKCWNDLKTDHFDVVKAIRPKCTSMQGIAKQMRIHKNDCVDKFKVCKKAQDYSILLIYHCQHFGEGEEWNPVTNETKVVADSKDLEAKAVVEEGINRNLHQFLQI